MGNNTSSKKTNIVAGVSIATSLLPLAQPLLKWVKEYIDKKYEDNKRLIPIPKLCSKGYPLTSEQAVELLERAGLKVTVVYLSMKEADAKYRDCINSQVVGSEPKDGHKVEPGYSVKIKCITQPIIDESQRLYEEAQKLKEQKLRDKNIKQAKRKEKTKQVVTDIISATKHGTKKFSVVIHNKNTVDDK